MAKLFEADTARSGREWTEAIAGPLHSEDARKSPGLQKAIDILGDEIIAIQKHADSVDGRCETLHEQGKAAAQGLDRLADRIAKLERQIAKKPAAKKAKRVRPKAKKAVAKKAKPAAKKRGSK